MAIRRKRVERSKLIFLWILNAHVKRLLIRLHVTLHCNVCALNPNRYDKQAGIQTGLHDKRTYTPRQTDNDSAMAHTSTGRNMESASKGERRPGEC